jgi:hypothetical protein
MTGNATEVRRGHNHLLDTLRAQRPGAHVLVHTRYLTDGVLHAYRPLDEALPLTSENYAPTAPTTPLFRQSVIALGSVIAKTKELEAHSSEVRSFTLLITDGHDNDSGEISAEQVRYLVTDMLEFSPNHIVAGMGIGEPIAFRQVFAAMGIPEQWILTPGSDLGALRDIFAVVVRSLQLAAQDEAGFRQIARGPAQ